jgi:hypothetical protein
MRNRLLRLTLAFSLVASQSPLLLAGGALETVNITGSLPSPIAGHIAARVIGIKWDTRALPVRYSLNTTLSPVPNPLGTAFLSLNDARAAFERSFSRWNAIPTSFIELQLTGTTGNTGFARLDFVNELTFRTAGTFNAIASSPSTALIADSLFEDGDDIDGDGDPDVSASLTTAADADADGDIEFPPGTYKAGTILDNDVQFNTKAANGLRFTVGDADIDPVTRSVDLECVAVHEFGHSFGLSHTLVNQQSGTDPTAATMFPFIDTGDPAAELSGRSLEIDDVAWASYFYPEGSAATGPGALQAGDVAFAAALGLIAGEVRHGVLNQPVAGAHVFARDWASGATGVSAFSGTTRLSFNPATGGLAIAPDVGFSIPDGKYVLPVPKGSYAIGVEATDGEPAAAANISFTAQIGGAFGQLNFNEELWNNNKESTVEKRPWQAKNVAVAPGKTLAGIDITTTRAFNLANYRALAAIGFVNSPPGRYFAVRVPASQIASITGTAPYLVHGALFNTYLLDASTPALYSEALVTTGTVDATGQVTALDLANPLTRTSGFLGQDGDFAPLFDHNPHILGQKLKDGIDTGTITDVFMVLRIPTSAPYPGVSAQPPLVGLSTAAPLFGLSYVSNDGVLWTKVTTADFRFALVLSEWEN